MGTRAVEDLWRQTFAELVYFDCVLNKAISVMARRAHEQRRIEQFDALLDELTDLIPVSDTAWISGEIQRLYDQVRETGERYG